MLVTTGAFISIRVWIAFIGDGGVFFALFIVVTDASVCWFYFSFPFYSLYSFPLLYVQKTLISNARRFPIASASYRS